MDTLNYIISKFNLEFHDAMRMPIEIPNYGRDNMAELFKELGFKHGVEVGVRQGEYSEILLKANPELTVYGVDPWEPHEGYRDHTRKSTFDKFYNETVERMKPYGRRFKMIRDYSIPASTKFIKESLDFVYLDGDHSFYNVAADIEHWLPKLKKGGILSGHDYFKHAGPSNIKVYECIRAYTDAYSIRPWFVLGSNAIIEGQIRDKARSWMFIKQ